MIVDDRDLKMFASYFINNGHLGEDFNKSLLVLYSFLRLTVALQNFNMSWKFIIFLPESYQIFEIHSYHHRRIKQESDYLAIRSGSEALCGICIRGGSHFHARRVLAVAPTLPQPNTLWGRAGAWKKQNNYFFSSLYIYLLVYFLTCLFRWTVMRCTSKWGETPT